tara:strand:+ start:106 stop:315 length:210 start_codon:yes stop_codon:yes gene_type:complete
MKTTKLFRGTYKVTGQEVIAEINNDCGYWEIEIIKGEELISFDWMQYSTKKEAVYGVMCYDLEAINKIN